MGAVCSGSTPVFPLLCVMLVSRGSGLFPWCILQHLKQHSGWSAGAWGVILASRWNTELFVFATEAFENPTHVNKASSIYRNLPKYQEHLKEHFWTAAFMLYAYYSSPVHVEMPPRPSVVNPPTWDVGKGAPFRLHSPGVQTEALGVCCTGSDVETLPAQGDFQLAFLSGEDIPIFYFWVIVSSFVCIISLMNVFVL